MALTIGARPFVVHDAHETKFSVPLYSSAFTPMTMVWVLSLAGAEYITFLAPPSRMLWAFSLVRNTPVDSQT